VPIVEISYPALDIAAAAATASAHACRWPNLRVVLIEVDEFSLLSDAFAAHEDLSPICGKLDVASWTLETRGTLPRLARVLSELLYGRGIAALYRENRLVFANLFRTPVATAAAASREHRERRRRIEPEDARMRIQSATSRFFSHGIPENAEHNTAALADWVSSLRGDGVEVILITMPTHPVYNAARPRSWDAAIARAVAAVRAAAGDDIQHWDYRRDPSFKAEDFSDADHLSRRGAAWFTQRIDARLRAGGFIR